MPGLMDPIFDPEVGFRMAGSTSHVWGGGSVAVRPVPYPIMDVLEVSWGYGLQTHMLPDTQVETPDGWVAASALKHGTRTVTPKPVWPWGRPIENSKVKAAAWLLGASLTDPSFYRSGFGTSRCLRIYGLTSDVKGDLFRQVNHTGEPLDHPLNDVDLYTDIILGMFTQYRRDTVLYAPLRQVRYDGTWTPFVQLMMTFAGIEFRWAIFNGYLNLCYDAPYNPIGMMLGAARKRRREDPKIIEREIQTIRTVKVPMVHLTTEPYQAPCAIIKEPAP